MAAPWRKRLATRAEAGNWFVTRMDIEPSRIRFDNTSLATRSAAFAPCSSTGTRPARGGGVAREVHEEDGGFRHFLGVAANSAPPLPGNVRSTARRDNAPAHCQLRRRYFRFKRFQHDVDAVRTRQSQITMKKIPLVGGVIGILLGGLWIGLNPVMSAL